MQVYASPFSILDPLDRCRIELREQVPGNLAGSRVPGNYDVSVRFTPQLEVGAQMAEHPASLECPVRVLEFLLLAALHEYVTAPNAAQEDGEGMSPPRAEARAGVGELPSAVPAGEGEIDIPGKREVNRARKHRAGCNVYGVSYRHST